jgi:hypothetical protein
MKEKLFFIIIIAFTILTSFTILTLGCNTLKNQSINKSNITIKENVTHYNNNTFIAGINGTLGLPEQFSMDKSKPNLWELVIDCNKQTQIYNQNFSITFDYNRTRITMPIYDLCGVIKNASKR